MKERIHSVHRQGDTDAGRQPCLVCGCSTSSVKRSDVCNGSRGYVHKVLVCEACIWHARTAYACAVLRQLRQLSSQRLRSLLVRVKPHVRKSVDVEQLVQHLRKMG